MDKLPLADVIAVNLDHYRLNADYKHGMHFTALPTAWGSGFDKTSNLRIGSSTAWVSETPGATAGFLEFHGQGLSTFERAMTQDEQLMAVLGSRIYWWNSTEPTPEAIGDKTVLMTLNSDFSLKGMASDEINAVVAAWKAGAISRDTMFDLFRMGDVLPVGRSNEDEAKLVGSAPQPSPGAVAPSSPAPAVKTQAQPPTKTQ